MTYYAERAGDIRFVVVDSGLEVTWVSDVVTAAEKGLFVVGLDQPVGVTAGSNLAVYSVGAGVVSFDLDRSNADPAIWEANGAGLPPVGATLDVEGQEGRYYSMNVDVEASSPAICKNGGWETYGYQNQGQCIASMVANENSGH